MSIEKRFSNGLKTISQEYPKVEKLKWLACRPNFDVIIGLVTILTNLPFIQKSWQKNHTIY